MMITNLQNDLDDSKDPSYNQGLSVQEVFESIMEKELPVFAELQEEAFAMMRLDLGAKHHSFQNRNSKAGRINENIRGLLYKTFPDDIKETPSQRFYFYKEDKYIILFKKLKENFMPMNISTKNARRILSQLSIEFPNQIPIVFVGYVANKSWDSIDKICAVYISGGKIVWVSDLRRLDGGSSNLDLFIPRPDDDSPILVKPKVKKSSEGEGNSKN